METQGCSGRKGPGEGAVASGPRGPWARVPETPRPSEVLADLAAVLAEGRRAREAAERRMAEDPPESLDDILAPYRPRGITVLRLSPDLPS